MRRTLRSSPSRWISALLVAASLSVAGCSEIQLISPYDEYTDAQTTALQRSVEELFTDLERGASFPDCSHASHESFYSEAAVELNLLIARNGIRYKNELTVRQLSLLKQSVGDLEELHRLADEEQTCLGPEEIAALRSGFDSAFTAILKLELAKKRGQGEGSGS